MGSPSAFPPAETADQDGLVAIGRRLDPNVLLDAYSHGIFPWPVSERGPIPWFSPDPRAILELDALHVSRRLERICRSGRFRITCDRDFEGVIHGCAAARRHGETRGTWITAAMRRAYCQLHKLGYAHSVETWSGKDLAGGIYGVTLGAAFFAESMFYRVAEASKVALVSLVRHLRLRGFELFDIQQLSPHLARLGAIEISRAEYLRRLEAALQQPATFGDRLEAP